MKNLIDLNTIDGLFEASQIADAMAEKKMKNTKSGKDAKEETKEVEESNAPNQRSNEKSGS